MQMIKRKRKGLGYRRVSGTSQKDNFSLKGQGDDIQEYYERNGIPLDKMFTDVGSGLSIKQRPEFVRKREYALEKSNEITDIAFWDLDRFTRNIKEFFEFTDPLLKAGIHLHLVLDDEEFDYHSADRWYQKLIDAQKESKRTSRRTKRGQRGATQEGRHIGKPPWGYTLIYDSDEKDAEGHPALCGRLAPDTATWEDCKTFWRRAEEGLTPMGLAVHMNRLAIPAPGGGEWTDGAARMVIRNHKYHGQLFRGVDPETRIPGPKEEAQPIRIENNHERAVSVDSWKRINEEMQKRSRDQGPTRVHSSPNAASGKLKCGHCSSNSHESNLQLHRQKDIVRLRCSRKKNVGGYDCGFKGVRLDAILPVLIDRLTNHFLTEDTLERVIDRIADESREYLETQETNQVGIRNRLRLTREKVRNLKENLNDGGLGPRSRKSLTEDLEQQLGEQEELEKDLERISVSSQEARLFVNNRDGIIETAMNMKTYMDPENLDAVRQFIKLFVEKVEVFDDGHAIVHYDLPVHSKGSEEGETKEIIYFEKKKTPVASQSCGLEQGIGLRPGRADHPLGTPPDPASSTGLALGGEVQPRPGPTASHSTPSLTAPVRHGPAIRTTERPRQLVPSRSASASCRVLSRHLAHHSHCRPPSAPPKAPADRRRPRIYPNSSPDHPRLLLPLPTSSVLTPSIPVHRWIRAYASEWRWSDLFDDNLGLIRARAGTQAVYWGLSNHDRMEEVFDREKSDYEASAIIANDHGLGVSGTYPFQSLDQLYETCDDLVQAFHETMSPLPPFNSTPPVLRAVPEIAQRL